MRSALMRLLLLTMAGLLPAGTAMADGVPAGAASILGLFGFGSDRPADAATTSGWRFSTQPFGPGPSIYQGLPASGFATYLRQDGAPQRRIAYYYGNYDAASINTYFAQPPRVPVIDDGAWYWQGANFTFSSQNHLLLATTGQVSATASDGAGLRQITAFTLDAAGTQHAYLQTDRVPVKFLIINGKVAQPTIPAAATIAMKSDGAGGYVPDLATVIWQHHGTGYPIASTQILVFVEAPIGGPHDVAPVWVLDRDSGPGRAKDFDGALQFQGRDSGGSPVQQAQIVSVVDNPASGASYRSHLAITVSGQNQLSLGHDGLYVDGLTRAMGPGTSNWVGLYSAGLMMAQGPITGGSLNTLGPAGIGGTLSLGAGAAKATLQSDDSGNITVTSPAMRLTGTLGVTNGLYLTANEAWAAYVSGDRVYLAYNGRHLLTVDTSGNVRAAGSFIGKTEP